MADPKKGTGKKPKGSGRRLYTDENPRDTVKIKFKINNFDYVINTSINQNYVKKKYFN